MKKLKIAVLSASLVGCATYAGDRGYTGLSLKELCDYVEDSCIAYVAGVIEGVTTFAEKQWLCSPNGVTNEQLSLVVKKFLNDHPELLHERAGFLVALALRKTFPCE